MIKLRCKTMLGDDDDLLVFGLTPRNIELLKAGKPIFFDGRELGIAAHICIMFGETELAILHEVQEKSGAPVIAPLSDRKQ